VKLNARNPKKRLKLLLIDRDLELRDLAARTGLSLSLVEKIATAKRAPTARSVARIENFFGERIFSSPTRYRARIKRAAARARPVIEFDESPAQPEAENTFSREQESAAPS
jgi:transcriptional regulator with XRE-family HTH domain